MTAVEKKDAERDEPKLCELEDFWKKADEDGKPGKRMTDKEMNEAKARGQW